MVVKLHKFTRAEYHRLVETGVLREDDRVELIDGVITEMSPIGPHHNAVVDFLNEFFQEAVRKRAIVRVQGSVSLPEQTEPEPDVALLKRRADRYRASHPGPDEILLILEVADASLDFDRGDKALLYARAGIREYWVVDLVKRAVAVHRGPSADGYRDITEYGKNETISSIEFPDIALPLARCFE